MDRLCPMLGPCLQLPCRAGELSLLSVSPCTLCRRQGADSCFHAVGANGSVASTAVPRLAARHVPLSCTTWLPALACTPINRSGEGRICDSAVLA
jgi:hypothetical protein